MNDVLSQILMKFNFKKEEITEYDKNLLLPFIIKVIEKFTSEKYFDKELLRTILDKLKIQRIFLRMTCFFENYLSIKQKDLKLFSGNVFFEYLGSDIFSTEYITIPLCDIFFICEDKIILWDHDGHLTIYRFKRVKATKI
jgi:hypothetical protein